jgi:hypothetical protein
MWSLRKPARRRRLILAQSFVVRRVLGVTSVAASDQVMQDGEEEDDDDDEVENLEKSLPGLESSASTLYKLEMCAEWGPVRCNMIPRCVLLS